MGNKINLRSTTRAVAAASLALAGLAITAPKADALEPCSLSGSGRTKSAYCLAWAAGTEFAIGGQCSGYQGPYIGPWRVQGAGVSSSYTCPSGSTAINWYISLR